MDTRLSDKTRAEILQRALENAHATLNLIKSIGFGEILNTPANRANAQAALDDASEALRIAGIDRHPEALRADQ